MEIRKDLFLKAALATLALFVISVYVGYTVESNSYGALESRLQKMESDIQDSLLFSLFMSRHSDSPAACSVLLKEMDSDSSEAYHIYSDLEQSKNAGILRNYEELRKRYLLANMRFYLLMSDYKDKCNDSSTSTILFFYSANNDCPACIVQGNVLDQVRQECKNARVFAFPADVPDVRMLETLKTYYSINGTPSLVINDGSANGQMDAAEIERAISCQRA